MQFRALPPGAALSGYPPLMKLLAVLLFAANAVFFAYTAGYLDSLRGNEVTRLTQQVAPEALKVLAVEEDRPVMPQPNAVASAQEGLAAGAAVKAGVEKQAATATTPEKRVCLRWRLAAGDAERLVHLFADSFPAFSVERQTVATDTSSWRVFIPIQAEKAEVERQRKLLNQKGLKDHFVISEAKGRHVISLGVYSTEKAGQAFMATLKRKGVEGARMAERRSKRKEGLLQVDATGSTAQQGKVEEAVARLLPEAKRQDCQ